MTFALVTFPVQIDECIYCRRADVPLSDEHIVPYGLNGQWVLGKASCQACSRLTSEFELDVMRRLFLGPRATLGLRTRRKRERPKTLPFRIDRGGSRLPIEVEIPQAPIILISPVFDAPAHVTGKPYQEGIVVLQLHISHIGPPSLADAVRALGSTKLTIDLGYKPAAFARMIAKIAYGFAVSQLGLSGLDEPYVVSAILGESDDIGRWVGCLPAQPRNAGPYLHAVTLRVVPPDLHASVRLFTEHHLPEYEVVVGRLSRAGLGMLKRSEGPPDA